MMRINWRGETGAACHSVRPLLITAPFVYVRFVLRWIPFISSHQSFITMHIKFICLPGLYSDTL